MEVNLNNSVINLLRSSFSSVVVVSKIVSVEVENNIEWYEIRFSCHPSNCSVVPSTDG